MERGKAIIVCGKEVQNPDFSCGWRFFEVEDLVDSKRLRNLSKFTTPKSSKYQQSGEISVKKLFQSCEIVVEFRVVYKRD